MKKVIILIIALVGMIGAKAQVQSDCKVPSQLTMSYDRDIKHLAVCRMFQIHSPDTVMVTIPQEYIDTIAEGLAGIVNTIPVIPESDSVFNMYCVHNRSGCPGEYEGYIVKVDTSYAWTDAWQKLQTMTGDPLMDTIITRYSLYVQEFYFWSSGCVAVINTNYTWNLYALCDTLEMVPGVIYASKNSMGGGGNYLAYNLISDERYYDFSYEWGDCTCGCIYHYIWKFKVNPDCEVTFLGVEANNGGPEGEPLPDPYNCNLFVSVNDNACASGLSIYPNPAADIITISLHMLFDMPILTVYNVSGEKVMERQLKEIETHLNVGLLPRGLYFLRVQDENGIAVRKIIKQ
jgi:hypothetical protein